MVQNRRSDSVSEFAMSELGATPAGRGIEYKMACVSCGKQDHMYLNVVKGVGTCFSCGYTFNLVRLLMDLHGVDLRTAIQEARQLTSGLLTDTRCNGVQSSVALRNVLLSTLQHTRAENVTRTIVELPANCVPITSRQAKDGRAYLSGRGFGLGHLVFSEIQYVWKRDPNQAKYWKHLVFVERDKDNNVIYWTTRAAYEPDKKYPKSYHPHGIDKNVLLGMSSVKTQGRYVMLVEGPLDMIAFQGCAVASLGRMLSDQQVNLLTNQFRCVVVMYDSDAAKQSVEAYEKLVRAGCKNVLRYEYRYRADHAWNDPAEAIESGMQSRELVQHILSSARRMSLRDSCASMQ